ncbi:ankyrin repeat-containing domain protein [Lactarius hatsudake]|nr:ankyrin repeat-containing domain protein [Lactarius hatsudake]
MAVVLSKPSLPCFKGKPTNSINPRAAMSDSQSGLRQPCMSSTLSLPPLARAWAHIKYQVFPPTKIIFSAMSILLVAARGTAASREVLIELFERIENFFERLQTHTQVPPTVQMTNVMGKVMAEVLSMLGVATKAMYQSRKKTFFKKFVGRNDIEDALLRLDKLEQGELCTVSTQVLKNTSDLKDTTSDIKDATSDIKDVTTDIKDATTDIKDATDYIKDTTTDIKDATSDIKDDTKETKLMVQQIVSDVSSREWVRFRGWLTPPDPSTNHTNACSTQHDCTAAWVFDDDIFKAWESSQLGSLLWIHGKAGSGKSILWFAKLFSLYIQTFMSAISSAIVQHLITLRDAGSASVAYFYFDFRDVDKKNCRNLVSSLLIQLSFRSNPCLDILSRVHSTYNDGIERPSERSLVKCLKDMLMALSAAQLPTYIVLDALDECPNSSGIPTPRGHVLGLVTDLVDLRLPNLHICMTSRPEIDIRTALEPLTSGHFSLHDQVGQKRDISEYVSSVVQSDPQMKRWREDDRKLVIDTLSEKADGMFRWVFCQLEMLRHCLAPSLLRQLNELPKSLDETYERVLKEIESTNQGRYARRLLQCLAIAMRPLRVEELAEVLAFDLEDSKAEIPTFHAECLVAIVGGDSDDSRVVQFSHFSVKEYLTSNRLATASGDVSLYHIDPEPAHLILAQACLGVLLNSDYCVVEESEDSAEESEDPAEESEDPAEESEDPAEESEDPAEESEDPAEESEDSAEEGSNENRAKTIPLLKYSAEHWASHAQVGNVSSRLKDAMEMLFDLNRPYFFAWRRIYDIYPHALALSVFGPLSAPGNPRYFNPLLAPDNPLYYAALCGFYDQVQCLIAKYPDQVNHDGSLYKSPLVVALFGKHVRVANLLLEHGAHAHVRGSPPLCHAIQFSDDARVDAVRFLLKHGAHVNSGLKDLRTPLHMAADVGDPEVARILLEHGADVDIRDNYGQVPLHLVSISERDFRSPSDKGGERSIIARLLVKHHADVNARDMYGATPLHFASRHWRFEICRLLLDNGANANARDVRGRNLLHELSQKVPYAGVKFQNILSIAELLLKHGVDVNALDEDGATPLHFASSYGMLELARLLLDSGAHANVKNVLGQTPLHLVSQEEGPSNEDPNIARLLLERVMDVNARDNDQATPLHFACYRGNFETALVLLDHGAEVNARDVDGQTPLLRISLGQNSRIAQLILERGADVNARDKDQTTPLHLACHVLCFETASVLLARGAKADARNADGQTPLHQVPQSPWVGDYHEISRITRLLLEHGASINALDNHQETPLHVACSEGRSTIAQVLLDHGADVSAHNADGQTPLHRVSQCPHFTDYTHFELAQLLLERDVDVNARDKHEETPLHLAAYRSSFEIAEVLIEHGADANACNADGRTPLHRVVSQCFDPGPEHDSTSDDAPNVARLLLEHGVDLNARDNEQATPLHLASYYGHVEVAEALLDHDVRANAEDIRGQTPLHQVLLGNHNYKSYKRRSPKSEPGKAVRLAQRLLERGADVNAQTKNHETPLHLASRLRLYEMARILLKHGADVDVKNSEGKSPLQLACGRKGKAMRRLLSK